MIIYLPTNYASQDGLPIVGLPQSAPPLNQSHLRRFTPPSSEVVITGFTWLYYLPWFNHAKGR